ncbi:alkaline phosphatase family protein [Actinorhabdospora filicis]|uniref:Alkaline phosphatase family protein n=1 Tax=Actinorhabdospora filicis TaxID=1785913 RepID=A0A9W6W6C5_9ACTN|nr:nucleotide pyrophosphatase/phosphodiesterase family protein [Actinorhabdospora filicis]GLZ75424.1 alkaline phosphatase family protein [Actinorhabdospora filicis]
MTGELDPRPPRYGEGSLADILPSALALLGVPGAPDTLGLREGPLAGVRRVAVLLVDGLGYRLLPKAAAAGGALAEVVAGRLGSLRALTAGFPSTTPVSLVTLGTGVPPGAHGVVGFTLNVPGTERVLNHIRWDGDPDPALWQPLETRFQRAAADGVSVSVVSRPEYAGSGLTNSAFRGAAYRPATTPEEVATGMRAALAEGARSFVYGYLPDVDSNGHYHGIGSPQWLSAVGRVDRLIAMLADGLPSDTAVLVTADHGMIDVPDDARVDLREHPELRRGVRVITGEARVRYVHTVPGAAGDVRDAWHERLGKQDVLVLTREEAVDTGWFGPVPPGNLERLGDVIAVCHGRTVILHVPESDMEATDKLRGYHGSITADEMEIPLIALRGGA